MGVLKGCFVTQSNRARACAEKTIKLPKQFQSARGYAIIPQESEQEYEPLVTGNGSQSRSIRDAEQYSSWKHRPVTVFDWRSGNGDDQVIRMCIACDGSNGVFL